MSSSLTSWKGCLGKITMLNWDRDVIKRVQVKKKMMREMQFDMHSIEVQPI